MNNSKSNNRAKLRTYLGTESLHKVYAAKPTPNIPVAKITHITTMPGQLDFALFEKVPGFLGIETSSENIENDYLHSCHIIVRDGFPVGRFAIYRNDQLSYEGKKAVCIGAYHCINDDFVARDLLNRAMNICESMGYEYIIGPMNGSTWNQYRFAIGDNKKSFFLDVNNPDYYNAQFKMFGFDCIRNYYSNLDENLDFDHEAIIEMEKFYESRGARIRNIDMEKIESELLRVAKFTNLAFVDNFLFTPRNHEAFVKQYLKLHQIFNPNFIWVVETMEKKIHAIFFAINDIKDPEGKSLIIKTIAVKPNSPYKGIATYLSRKLSALASSQGYERIFHALMSQDNLSLNASLKYGTEFKQYALYGKQIIPAKF